MLLLNSVIGLPAMAQTETTGQPTIVSDAGGLTFTWTPPAYTLDSRILDGETYSLLSIPGITADGEPGRPALPVYSAAVGIPIGAQAQLDIVAVETEIVDLPHQLLPSGTPLEGVD